MTPDTPRAVYDCNIFLQALIAEGGPAAACIGLVDARQVTLLLSPETLAEAADVLSRPQLRRKFHTLSDKRVREFLEHAQAVAVMVTDVPPLVKLARDPKDEKYINLAVAAGAKYLVTRDKDLLDLMNDQAFRNQYPDFMILDPVAFLKRLLQNESTVEF